MAGARDGTRMDPISALLGFSRLLAPPRAEPAGGRKPMDPASDLGLDRHLVQAQKEILRQAGVQPKRGPEGAGPAEQARDQVGPPPQAEQVKAAKEAGEVDPIDLVELANPLMATRMRAIYTDSLVISAHTRRLFLS